MFVAPPPDTVVVTAPPLRFKLVAPTPESEKVRFWFAVGAIVIAPPAVDNVAVDPLGNMIFNGFAPPPEFTEIVPAPAAETVDPVPIFNVGLDKTIELPPATVVVEPLFATSEPPVA